MANRIIYPEFRDELEFTRYPFADSATLVSSTGFTIPNEAFLDAALHPIGGRTRQYISLITIDVRKVTIRIGDSVRSNLCEGTFDPLEPPDVLRFFDSYGRPAGILVSEAARLAFFSSWDTGEHAFTLGTTELVASCVISTPEPGVRGLLTPVGDLFTGDVWLVGDNGVVVRDTGDGNIRIDIVGDPLFRRKLCGSVELFNTPNIIRTINGCPPDEHGNFQLNVGNLITENTLLRINPTDTGLRIEAVGQTVVQNNRD